LTANETNALIRLIHNRWPHEPLTVMELGGGLYALRMESTERNGKIVWSKQDWEETYLGVKPQAIREEEAEWI